MKNARHRRPERHFATRFLAMELRVGYWVGRDKELSIFKRRRATLPRAAVIEFQFEEPESP